MQLRGYAAAYKQGVNGLYLCRRPWINSQQGLTCVILVARTGYLEPVTPSVHRCGSAHDYKLRRLRALVKGAVTKVVPSRTLVDLPYCGLSCPGVEHL